MLQILLVFKMLQYPLPLIAHIGLTKT